MTTESAYQSLRARGFTTFPAESYRSRLELSGVLHQLSDILQTFDRLAPDRHMGDGGTYRNRAYSRFLLNFEDGVPDLAPLEGHSIFQTLEDNSVNGGVLRTYEPLAPEVGESRFLRALILEDAAHAAVCDPELMRGPVQVGVHQVRIVARTGTLGMPTPEGIHRDSERFTFQHFCRRLNIEGGEFRAYDQNRQLQFAWLQTETLDTVMFEGTTWHSATPVACVDSSWEGYRDIFLIDFDKLDETTEP